MYKGVKIRNNQTKEVIYDCIETVKSIENDDDADQECLSFKFKIIIQSDDGCSSLTKHINITVTGKINSVVEKSREFMREYDEIEDLLCFGKNQIINDLITSETKKK